VDTKLTDRVAVVTGAGSGIGQATTRLLRAEGARVVAADLDRGPAAGEGVQLVPVDLSVPGGPEAAIDRAVTEHGRIDVLVNNVGVLRFRGGFTSVTDDDWRSLLDVNFYSVVRATRAAVPHMLAQGRGAIVSIASDMGRQPEPFAVDYAVSKAAILMLSKAISREYGREGIRSNCVSPGPTRTPAWDVPGGFSDSLAERFGMATPDEAVDHFAREVKDIPLGRLGTGRGDRPRRRVPGLGSRQQRDGSGLARRRRRHARRVRGEIAMADSTGRRVAMITGAAAGIGQAYAARLARDGMDIVIGGRRRRRRPQSGWSRRRGPTRSASGATSPTPTP
jgi:NAD(P)-dependent dehydrogenase (short-subunit alcohol dehydrogenase family)